MSRHYLFVPIMLLAACRGEEPEPAASGASASASAPGDAAAAVAPPPQAPAPAPASNPAFELGEASEDEALAAAGAIPVWNAVIDRGSYLARRRQQGVLFGRIGNPVERYQWLIDESEGYGALGIRFLHGGPAVQAGQRVVVWGAWQVDENLRWFWQAERLALLPARDSDIPPQAESVPGHEIVTIEAPPEGAIPVSERTREPGDIIFEVVRIPADPLLGWEISDRSDWKPVARLFLPGERSVYGAQDYRSPSERWQLERGVRYVVRVGRFVAPRPGSLIRMNALNAPRRLVTKSK